ncbi:hypothetical protein TSMEX_004569 [Taenia solium]|eukprot:TsM_000029000 transcript=TsM_000029000 gene=TsM_000029000
MSRNIPLSSSRNGKIQLHWWQRWRTSPHFKDDMDLKGWMKTARFYTHLYPQRWRVSLTLHVLPQELFLAAINAGVTADFDIGHCCAILSQLAIDQREQSTAREFFHRDQKSDQLGGRLIPCEGSTADHRRKAPCHEDQRSQSVGRGCDQVASGTPPDIGAPDGPPPTKPATPSLDSLTSDPESR